MPTYEDDALTIKELHRTICDFREEWRTQIGLMVRKDVHGVEHEALTSRISRNETEINERIRRLETDRAEDKKEKASLRNGIIVTAVGAAFSLIIAVIVAAINF